MISYTQEADWLIPFEDTIRLCGKDYYAEADSWLSAHQIRQNSICVLGLGAGFHIDALVQQGLHENIIVVDTRPQLETIFKNQFSHIADKVEIVFVETVSELLSHHVFETLTKQALHTICFRPCWGSRVELFEQLLAAMTARSMQGLSAALKVLGHSLDITESFNDQKRYLNIRDLNLVVEAYPTLQTQFSAVKILRELVA